MKKQSALAKAQSITTEYSNKLYSPGTVSLQVIGSGVVGAPKSVYLVTDQNRYLFNCREGTQHLGHEHKIKLAKLEHIFITTSTWGSIGGLPGISLTLQDCGVSDITLHGPPGLTELYEATSRFVVMKNLNVKMAKCQPYLPYDDPVMSVSYVPLMKEGTGSYKSFLESEQNDKIAKEKMSRRSDSPSPTEFDDTDYNLYEHKKRSGSPDTGSARKRSRSPSRNRKKEMEDAAAKPNEATAVVRKPEREQSCSMAYICRLKKRLGQLKSGHDVVLENERIIRASDVRSPDDSGPILIVLDVPDENYLQPLLTEKLFHEFRSSMTPGQSHDNLPSIIIHFTPHSIVMDERYRSFIADFSPYTQHLFVNDSNVCLGSIPLAPLNYNLNSKKELSKTAAELSKTAANEYSNQLATVTDSLDGELIDLDYNGFDKTSMNDYLADEGNVSNIYSRYFPAL